MKKSRDNYKIDGPDHWSGPSGCHEDCPACEKPTHTPTETTPYIWAQENEEEAIARCGCRLDCASDGPALYRCENCVRAVNLHQELLAAAVLARKTILENGELTDALVRAHNILDKAITKAEAH